MEFVGRLEASRRSRSSRYGSVMTWVHAARLATREVVCLRYPHSHKHAYLFSSTLFGHAPLVEPVHLERADHANSHTVVIVARSNLEGNTMYAHSIGRLWYLHEGHHCYTPLLARHPISTLRVFPSR